MRKYPIATVVNFCTNEARFIKACLEQAQIFSSQVIVAVCDHFFDGSEENRSLLQEIYGAFPNCLFIEYPFIPQKIPKKIWRSIDPAHFWHSLSRLLAYQHLDNDIESVLFLDADEVPDGKRFSQWLNDSDYLYHASLKFSNYWYFRESCNQALCFEDSIVLAQKKMLESSVLLKKEERDAIYDLLPAPKRRHVMGSDGAPMFHHFSWVRTEDEMLKKVKSWGHKGDREWEELVKESFKTPFSGKDFVHGYSYKKVNPLFDIRLEGVEFKGLGAPRLRKITEEEVLNAIKFKKFWNFLDF